MQTDRYQGLRDAIAAGAVLVALKRPEGYEDVHPEILIDDAAIHPTFEPEHVGAELAALLRERDTLRAVALLALYHHQGGFSPVGQPIRRALGIGQFDAMTDEQLAIAKRAALAEWAQS